MYVKQLGKRNFSLALCMIVKNCKTELQLLQRCLEPVKGIFDHTVVVLTGDVLPLETIEGFEFLNTSGGDAPTCSEEFKGVEFVPFKWEGDFSAARNFSFSKTTADYICWLDADDVIENPVEFARQIHLAVLEDADWIWFAYDYDRNEQGRCLSLFWRERVVRRGMFEWTGMLHEYLTCKAGKPKNVDVPLECAKVTHWPDKSDIALKAERNLEIIINRYNHEHKNECVGVRTVYDLGRSFQALGRWQDAVCAYEELLAVDCDGAVEGFDACCRLSSCLRKLKLFEKARMYALGAISRNPGFPDGYIELAETFYAQERYAECRHLLEKIVPVLERPLGTVPTDPERYTFRPLLFLQDCMFRMFEFEKAHKLQKKALSVYPHNEWLCECEQVTRKTLEKLKLEQAAMGIYSRIEDKADKAEMFVNSLPEEFSDHPFFVRQKNRFNPPDPERRVVFYCGPTVESWGPESEKSGIGGSEEAVINISRRLAALGWNVEVYCSTPEQCEKDGVKWFFTDQFDTNAQCEVFVAWRHADYVHLAPQNSLALLWLHDVPNPADFNEKILARVARIMVLSKFHRKCLPEIADEKFWITSNGIDPEHFASGEKRNPLKCFYASSPDRGLDLVLEGWEEVVKKVPDAQLHVFYGFTKTYDEFARKRPEMERFKEQILNRMQAAGNVVFHGRVSHAQLARQMQTCGLWLYPTYFDEISCITAMKAQAAGAVPVCAQKAALDETVQFGIKCGKDIYENFDHWVEQTVRLLEQPELQEIIRNSGMSAWACENFSYEKLASDWSSMFRQLGKEQQERQLCAK